MLDRDYTIPDDVENVKEFTKERDKKAYEKFCGQDSITRACHNVKKKEKKE